MEDNKEKKQQNSGEKINNSPEGTATHSGWGHFYVAFAKYRDECIELGKKVLGNNLNIAIACLSDYHSALYSLAQQVFIFYDGDAETNLTDEWLTLGEEVNDYLSKVSDKDFRNQMSWEGEISINRDLKVKLLKYFNKIDRMAAEAGLHVGKEDKGVSEPKKGLIGFLK